MAKKIWRLPQVIAHTGLSRSTIYHKIENDEFPHSIHLGVRSVGWIADEVDQWIQSRIDASRSGESE
jgi:prophage regulatory protein